MQKYKTNSLKTEKPFIKCENIVLDFTNPLIMGILNVTPDSFFDGGKYNSQKTILNKAAQMLEEGADIIDLGAYSTRPGATEVSVNEELSRILPAVKCVRKEFPDAVLSIDTFRSEIAKQVVEQYGKCIINDISGGTMDEQMYDVVGHLDVPYIITHIQGTPQNMQEKPVYKNVIDEILLFFNEKLKQLTHYGAKSIILDPGFGFGKSLEHNYEIMARLTEFNELKLPLLVGVSRKSMIFKLLDIEPNECLNGTTALNTIALLGGANILRVHDVKEAVETIKIFKMLKKQL